MISPNVLLNYVKRKEVPGLLIAALCTYMLFPFFLISFVYPVSIVSEPWYSLDASWLIAINKIIIDGKTWGSDFTFTYGPLAYLATRLAWGVSKYHLVLFDLFLSFNFFCVFYGSFVKSPNAYFTFFLILIATLLAPTYFGPGTSIVLMAILIYWIRQGLESGSYFNYFMQVSVMVLLFFIKFNTGLISFILFFAGLVYQIIKTPQARWQLAVVFSAPFILIYVLSFPLKVSLMHYVKGGMEMVSGYNEIMYINEPYFYEFLYALIVLGLAGLSLLVNGFENRNNVLKQLVVIFISFTSLYVLYKQAFTRTDKQHIGEFYGYCLLIILCIQDFHFTRNKNILSMVAVIILLITYMGKRKEESLFRYTEKLMKPDYENGYKAFNDSAGLFLFPNNNQLPQVIKNKIGKEGADVYPWNVHLLLENRLAYAPRPVFQSYTSYTPYLENLNYEFYNSLKAPNHVFYEYCAIDSRYPLFDEPKLNLSLLKNYTCTDTFTYGVRLMLLLKKKPQAGIKPIGEKIKEYTTALSAGFKPNPGSYYEVYVKNSIKGKLHSLLRYAPDICLVVHLVNGQEHQYKTSTKLLESGLFSDRWMESTLDFYHAMEAKGQDSTNTVDYYSFRVLDTSYFNPVINIKEYRIN